MWANAQPGGRPAEYRWHRLFNAAKFGCFWGIFEVKMGKWKFLNFLEMQRHATGIQWIKHLKSQFCGLVSDSQKGIKIIKHARVIFSYLQGRPHYDDRFELRLAW